MVGEGRNAQKQTTRQDSPRRPLRGRGQRTSERTLQVINAERLPKNCRPFSHHSFNVRAFGKAGCEDDRQIWAFLQDALRQRRAVKARHGKA